MNKMSENLKKVLVIKLSHKNLFLEFDLAVKDGRSCEWNVMGI